MIVLFLTNRMLSFVLKSNIIILNDHLLLYCKSLVLKLSRNVISLQFLCIRATALNICMFFVGTSPRQEFKYFVEPGIGQKNFSRQVDPILKIAA